MKIWKVAVSEEWLTQEEIQQGSKQQGLESFDAIFEDFQVSSSSECSVYLIPTVSKQEKLSPKGGREYRRVSRLSVMQQDCLDGFWLNQQAVRNVWPCCERKFY